MTTPAVCCFHLFILHLSNRYTSQSPNSATIHLCPTTQLIVPHELTSDNNVECRIPKVQLQTLPRLFIIYQSLMLINSTFHVHHPSFCCSNLYLIVGMSSDQPRILPLLLSVQLFPTKRLHQKSKLVVNRFIFCGSGEYTQEPRVGFIVEDAIVE